MSRELFGRSREMFVIVDEIEPLLERTLETLNAESKMGSKKPKEG